MVEKTTLNDTDLINSVVYFGALGWCQPCKVLHPLMEQLSSEYESLSFIYVDVDKADPQLVQDFAIRSVPTVQLYINGEKKREGFGLKPRSDYQGWFNEYI